MNTYKRHRFPRLRAPQKAKRDSKHGCWEPLWRVEEPRSGVDPDRKVPFAGGDSASGMSLKEAEKLHWLPVSAVKRNKQHTQENMVGNVALITGASSGIGEEFARLHARKGGDLVLVARLNRWLSAVMRRC